jgi:hypothetical protein
LRGSATLSKKAFMLIFCLMIGVLLLVMGMGLMSTQSRNYQASLQAGSATQALVFAQSGLEDARVKLNIDHRFRPRSGEAQNVFSYSEEVKDDAGKVVGGYFVVVNYTYDVDPYRVILLTSSGRVGPADKPVAQRSLRAELDHNLSRPGYFRWTSFQDDSGL